MTKEKRDELIKRAKEDERFKLFTSNPELLNEDGVGDDEDEEERCLDYLRRKRGVKY